MNSTATSPASAKENLRATLIIFSGIVTGVFVFMLVAVFISQTNGPFVPGLNKYQTIITWGIAAFSLVCLIVGRHVLRKDILAAKISLNPLNDKLNKYRSSLIRYLVICEVPALLGVILFMLTGNFVFQVFSAVLLGFMLAAAPIRRRAAAALELNGSEQSELE
jgi:MFS family permease